MGIPVNSNGLGFIFTGGIGHSGDQIVDQVVWSPTKNVVVVSLNLYCQLCNGIGKLQRDKQFFACLESLKPFLCILVYVATTVKQEAAGKAPISLLKQLGEDLVIVSLAQATVN